MSEEQNKAPNEGEARVLSDEELKGIVGGFVVGGGVVKREKGENREITKRAARAGVLVL